MRIYKNSLLQSITWILTQKHHFFEAMVETAGPFNQTIGLNLSGLHVHNLSQQDRQAPQHTG